MSIFSMFNTPVPAPVAPTAPATPNASTPVAATPVAPGNIPASPEVVAAANNPTAPVAPAPTDTPTGDKVADSPLAEYAQLWDPIAIKEGTPAPNDTSLNPEKLQEIISKADFSQSLNQDNLAKIAAGGEDAVGAFTESLNSVAQQVLMQATLAANRMTEQAVSAAVAEQNAKIPELIRSATTSANLIKANPLFQNPAVKPVIDAVRTQLAIKNPDATPDQLTEMAQNFVSVMGEQFAPPKPAAQSNIPGQPAALDATDWSKFI